MGTSGSLTNTQLPMPEDADMGIETPKYLCSGHEDPRLIDKYRLVIAKTPCFHSGTHEAQLLSAKIIRTPAHCKVIERRTLNIARKLRSSAE
jgi:hypothetical protein